MTDLARNAYDKKLIIFDLDGCLADTGGEIALMMNLTRERLGLGPLSEDYVVAAVGRGLRRLFDLCMADAPELIEQALAISPDIYVKVSGTRAKLFPGAVETLQALKAAGRKVGLATNKIRRATEALLARRGIADYFDAICCADDCGSPKPNPECLLYILNKLDVQPSDALMVGDTPTDVKTAANAGLDALAVTYGMAGPEAVRAAQPFLLADSMAEVLALCLPNRE